jgi:hypothetical protein
LDIRQLETLGKHSDDRCAKEPQCNRI